MSSSQEAQLSVMMQASLLQGGGSLPQPALIAITLCLSALALVGIFGNFLVVIFFHKNLRDLPQNVYVIALATLDMAVCAIVIPSTIYQDVWREATTDALCKGFHVLRCSLVTSSAFLLCLIAVDRFAIICFVPGIQTGRRRSVRLIGLTLLLGFAVGTPLGLTTGTRYIVNVRMNGTTVSRPITLAHCRADYSILTLATVKIYKACLTMLFLCLLLAIVFFYANIFYFVRRRQRRWKKSRSYVSRVAEGKKAKGRREDNEESGGDGSSAEGRGSSVRFLNKETAVCRGVLETDIDLVLGEPANAAANAAAADENAAGNNEFAARANTEARADTESTPAEQRQMLGGGQRREDSVTSNRLSRAQRHLSERSRKRPHIKTAKVLSIITFFYLLSYLPFFLVFLLQEASGIGGGGGSGSGLSMESLRPHLTAMNMTSWHNPFASMAYNGSGQSGFDRGNQTNNWWHHFYSQRGAPSGVGSSRNSGGGIGSLFMKTVYYFYFINHGVNPIIYGCMNTYFKQQVYGMYSSIRMSCRGGCGS